MRFKTGTIYFSLFLLVFFASINSYGAELKNSIAVLDLKISNIDSGTGSIVRNRIEYNLFKTRRFNLLERTRIDIIRKEKSISGGDSLTPGYASAAGKLLPADFVVTGEITRKEKIYINLVLVRTSDGDIIYSYNKSYDTEDELINDTELIASKITEEIIYNSDPDNDSIDGSEASHFYFGSGAGYIFHTGKLGDAASDGFIFNFETGIKDFLFNGFRAGFHGAYAHLYTESDINYISLIPLQIHFSYEFQPLSRFFLGAGVGGGSALVTVNKEDSVYREIETCGFINIDLKYFFRKYFAVKAFYTQYRVFERDGDIDLRSLGCGFETFF